MTDLNEVHQHLWFTGVYGHVETLHHQRVLLRTIIPSVSPRLHMIWFDRTIYIMRLPDYLLNAGFYSDVVCKNAFLYGTIIGFLRSYCFLIQFPLDLVIAKETNLVPKEVTWTQWISLRETVLRETEYTAVNKHYKYGELRLHRLDLIYRLTGRRLTYFTVHREYQTYFADYFAVVATAFAFVATILTAMQNVVNIEDAPAALVTTCYRFSIIVLVAVCACLRYIGLIFILLYTYHFVAARSAKYGDENIP